MNFKAHIKYIVAGLLLAGIAGILFVSGRERHAGIQMTTCSSIVVEFSDDMNFINADDVKDYIAKGYGNCSGKRLEEIDLGKIEEVLDKKSAIRKSEAYTTTDGTLHIMISQRKPVVRFVSDKGGWYADETGFIFPLQKKFTSRVPIVDGAIPLDISRDYKGLPKTKYEKAWVEGILDFVQYLNENRKWRDAVAQIHVEGNGHLVIVPRNGREKFEIGRPDEFKKKFAKIEDYYKFIVPEKGADAYTKVNVSFDGQIVCRK